MVAAVGSRGDVEPFALVAAALAGRGHQVVLCLDPGYHEGAGAAPNLERIAIGDLGAADLAAIVEHAISAPTPGERSRRAFAGFLGSRLDEVAARVAELDGAGFDVLVLPACLLFPSRGEQPSTYRIRWSTPTAGVIHVPAPFKEFLEMSVLPCLRLAALTPLFAPRDANALPAPWTFTGFWIKVARRPLADPVERFLQAGSPPFFLTMGSMVGFDARGVAEAFVAAARRAGRRAIVQRGWAGLEALPAGDVLTIGEIDYATLFPRCAAVFTHGGTGTVAHALRAGRPVGILPLVPDQVLWAESLVKIGNGVGFVDPSSMRSEDLDELMWRADHAPGPARVASELAAGIAAEDGLATACDALEGHARRGQPAPRS